VERLQEVLETLCDCHQIIAIAEEWSEASSKRYGVSETVAKRISINRGYQHLYADPPPEVQNKLAIWNEGEIKAAGSYKNWSKDQIHAEINNSYRKRENYWLKGLEEFNVWPALFVCGSEHFDPFADLLRSAGISVHEEHKDWPDT